MKKLEKDKSFLGTEPVGKLLMRLALPTVAAQLINMLYNIVDRIYIGHIPESGALALTGVGVCMPLIMVSRQYMFGKTILPKKTKNQILRIFR